MKNKFIQSIVIVLTISIIGICLAGKKPGITRVTFNLEHINNATLHFYSNESSEEMEVKKNHISLCFEQSKPAYYHCVLNLDSFLLYMNPGDSITIEADLNILHESIKITGSEACNYLLRKEQMGNQDNMKDQFNLLDTIVKDKKKYHGFIAAEYNKILRQHTNQNMFYEPVVQNQANPDRCFSIYPDIHLKTSVHSIL
jgi:hypothetical protein